MPIFKQQYTRIPDISLFLCWSLFNYTKAKFEKKWNNLSVLSVNIAFKNTLYHSPYYEHLSVFAVRQRYQPMALWALMLHNDFVYLFRTNLRWRRISKVYWTGKKKRRTKLSTFANCKLQFSLVICPCCTCLFPFFLAH